jgi:hypothetical protein
MKGTYEGQINELGHAHGFGIVSFHEGEIKGVFDNGAPSVALCRFLSGDKTMTTYDGEGKLHGSLPLLSSDGTQGVRVFNHGTQVCFTEGLFVFSFVSLKKEYFLLLLLTRQLTYRYQKR